MDTLRCFDSVRLGINIYDGAAEKTSFVDDGKRYLLKFGQANEVKRWADQASYTNTPVNEYLGSKIFASTGIPTQEVFLGTYQGRSCVACLDFTYDEGSSARLIPFKQLETSMPGESSRSQRTPSLEFLTHVFNDHEALGSLRAAAFERYRQTICVDALIGNFDWHTGNWGFLSFDDGMTISELAPVYDCGSSLYSQTSDETIEKLLSSDCSPAL